MIFIIPCGDLAVDAIAKCADNACEECGAQPADVLARVVQVTRRNVERCRGTWGGRLVTFWGHGNEEDEAAGVEAGTALINSHGHWVIDVHNVALLAHTAGIFAVACHSAKTLGPAAVTKGLPFYMGFCAKFYVALRGHGTAEYPKYSGYPLFSAALKKYRQNRDWVELAKLARVDLLMFAAQPFLQRGFSLADSLNIVVGKDWSVLLMARPHLLPATRDAVVQAAAGSQNLACFKVIPAPPEPTAA